MTRAWGCIIHRDGKFYGQVRSGGRKLMRLLRHDDLARTPVTDKLDAEPAMERLRAALATEADLVEGRSVSLGFWLDEEYSQVLRSRTVPHSAEQAEAYLVRFWTWAIARLGEDAVMSDVGRGDAEAFLADFLAGRVPSSSDHRAAKARYRASYARRVVNVIRRAWGDAIARGLAEENPWSRIQLPRIEETVVPWVAPRDLERLLRAVEPQWQPLFRLLAGTGLRISEAYALRWEDVDLRAGVVHVRSGKTRGARRTVPLPAALRAELRGRRPRAGGPVVAPASVHGAAQALTRACHRARLPRISPHRLRHVYASHLVVAGTPPTVVAALLGHVDGGSLVLRLYGRWYPADAQSRAVAALDRFRATTGTRPASRSTRGRPSAPAARSCSASRGSAPSRG